MSESNFRILVIDDNPNIHRDFIKILSPDDANTNFENLADQLFGKKPQQKITLPKFQIDVALQGKEGVRMIQKAIEEGKPYALAFVDIRMPPGWNGIETIKHIWEIDKDIQLVICTAYSDYSWEETVALLGNNDNYLILKKPFEIQVICQLACALTKKWQLNRQVRENIEQLNETTRAKSAFLAAMSHEIRTPLNAIIGMSEIMKDHKLTVEQHKDLNVIYNSGKTLLVLINDILDFSKIESGSIQIHNEPFSLQYLLTELIEMVSGHAKAREIIIKVEIDKNVPKYLNGDAYRIKQVLINLLNNAIKFTEKGSVTLKVKVDPHNNPNKKRIQLLFDIIDTGIGIEPQVRAALFQPFFQGDISITKKYGGTGLGLIISKRLVELMGGTIGVASEPGSGSNFWFIVPLNETTSEIFHQSNNVIELAARKKTAFTNSAKHARILLVEDNEINQMVAKRILMKLGYDVDIAVTGREALQAIKQKDFNIILMDCQMPDMDGYTATREIRKYEQRHHRRTPIIALTAHAFQSESEKCLKCGMDAYISKPMDVKLLTQLLEKWANKKVILT